MKEFREKDSRPKQEKEDSLDKQNKVHMLASSHLMLTDTKCFRLVQKGGSMALTAAPKDKFFPAETGIYAVTAKTLDAGNSGQ